jgi:phage replication-related protein YjqB (UPF0714/DUF867 family)
MPPPYLSYAALAAEQTEGVDYTRTATLPVGASWNSIAIHGGGIEPGSGEIAREVAGGRMGHYEFAGIKPSGNFDLHITSSLFDEPMCVAQTAAMQRTISWHGYTGTAGVPETLIGGLDAGLRDRVEDELTAAGFTVTQASSELAGTDTSNICNKNANLAGLQLELSLAQRQAFFPAGDTSAAVRNSGARTATFAAYAAAVIRAVYLRLTSTSSKVTIRGPVPGVWDQFARVVASDWGDSDSGHTWLRTGGSAANFLTNGSQAVHSQTSINVSRWSTAAMQAVDLDFSATVATDKLAVGGSHFLNLAGRFIDSNNVYLLRVEFTTGAAVNLTLRKRVGGVETLLASDLATGLVHAAGTRFGARLQIIGGDLKGRVWLASGAEPAVWNVTVADASINVAGRIGIRSILSSANTNVLPVDASYDDVLSRGDADVERSIDGATWTAIAAGTGLPGDADQDVTRTDVDRVPGVRNYYRIRAYEPLSGADLFTETDSLVPRINVGAAPAQRKTLGTPSPAGGMAAVIYGKGGTPQVAAPGVLSAVEWGRVLDGTSDARVVIPVAGNRCSELADVEPWSHELGLFRNGELVWEGPITRVVDSRAERTITLEAKDVTAWLSRRICAPYDTTGLDRDLANTAGRMLRASLQEEDPNIRLHILEVATGIAVDRIVAEDSTYALSDLKQLAGLGLNFTAVGRRIVLFGAAAALSNIRRLTDSHFTGDLPLVRTDKVTTRATLAGDGVTGTYGAVSARYGLLEQLDRAEGTINETQLVRGAKSRVNGRPPVVVDTGQAGSLKKTAPVIMSELVPGAWAELHVRGNCSTRLQVMRLEQLRVSWTPGNEQVGPTFVPLNDYGQAVE